MIVIINPLASLSVIDEYTFNVVIVAIIVAILDVYVLLNLKLLYLILSRNFWIISLSLFIAWNCISFDRFVDSSSLKLEPITYKAINFSPVKDSNLFSEQGSIYLKLRDLLIERKFKAADAEVRKAMNISEIPIAKQSCRDFKLVDNLWRLYSDGKFGFKIQSEIRSRVKSEFYKRIHWMFLTLATNVNLSRRADEFSLELLGWKSGDTFNYDNLIFSLDAPSGHLPYSISNSGYMVDQKVSECGM
jgi:GUN4-like